MEIYSVFRKDTLKVHQQKGYILHCTAYSESSLLVNAFTREFGRLSLIAKGAKRKKSTSKGLLLPFKPVYLSWSGKGQLPTLTGIEQSIYLPELGGASLYCGYYINELILKLLHRHDPHESLFDHYDQANRSLINCDSPNQVLRAFEKILLKETGFGLVLDHDADTGEMIDINKVYRYFPEVGPIAIKPVNGHETDHKYGLIVHGNTLLSIDRGEFSSAQVQSESQKLFRALINIQLNGKELRTRRVMRELNRYMSKGVVKGAGQ